ncbi:TPA: hypothetical protein HA231_04550 [Candidatus Woesearchaeota archaeon]|nr:hypothetical protein [Candidatus Woesearchaeota archaeon]
MKVFAVATAGGVTGIAISAVCAALVAVFPVGFAMSYAGSLFHGMNVSAFITRPQFTFTGIMLGLFYAFLTGFAIGAVFSAAYNWIGKRIK